MGFKFFNNILPHRRIWATLSSVSGPNSTIGRTTAAVKSTTTGNAGGNTVVGETTATGTVAIKSSSVPIAVVGSGDEKVGDVDLLQV